MRSSPRDAFIRGRSLLVRAPLTSRPTDRPARRTGSPWWSSAAAGLSSSRGGINNHPIEEPDKGRREDHGWIRSSRGRQVIASVMIWLHNISRDDDEDGLAVADWMSLIDLTDQQGQAASGGQRSSRDKDMGASRGRRCSTALELEVHPILAVTRRAVAGRSYCFAATASQLDLIMATSTSHRGARPSPATHRRRPTVRRGASTIRRSGLAGGADAARPVSTWSAEAVEQGRQDPYAGPVHRGPHRGLAALPRGAGRSGPGRCRAVGALLRAR